jgi:hypothetical protein
LYDTPTFSFLGEKTLILLESSFFVGAINDIEGLFNFLKEKCVSANWQDDFVAKGDINRLKKWKGEAF